MPVRAAGFSRRRGRGVPIYNLHLRRRDGSNCTLRNVVFHVELPYLFGMKISAVFAMTSMDSIKWKKKCENRTIQCFYYKRSGQNKINNAFSWDKADSWDLRGTEGSFLGRKAVSWYVRQFLWDLGHFLGPALSTLVAEF